MSFSRQRCTFPVWRQAGIPSRIVIGSIIIKELKNLSDEETIEDIQENPYFQYFLGYDNFQDRQVFTPSLFVEIRKRLGAEQLNRINETYLGFTEPHEVIKECSDKDSDNTEHKGMLIMDATVAPQDITYPTDVGLLNKTREKLEKIIDELWVPEPGKIKPRTYRQKAHTHYLAFSRKRKPRSIHSLLLCHSRCNLCRGNLNGRSAFE